LELFNKIKQLIIDENIRISDHGYDELANDGLFVKDIISGITSAKAIEEYPDYPKGASILILQRTDNNPVHIVWGIPKGYDEPAVLITAYRPSLDRWDSTFTRRKNNDQKSN